jgi:type II secretion system protein H
VNRRGFTLIELTVVLAIVVVATGILVLRVAAASPRQSLEASARALGTTIRAWRERARADEETYTLRMAGHSWTLSAGPSEILKKGELGAGQEFGRDTPATLSFTPRGVLPETRITLGNRSGETITLRIHPLLNVVEVADGR